MSDTLFQEELPTAPPIQEEADDDEGASTPLDKLSLPKDKDLPPIIREIVTNAPASRKIPCFIASLAPLCALASRIRVKYYHDTTRMHSLLLQVVIEGAQSSGKSFAADIESLIMNDTLKARDKEQRRLEQEYREKKKRRKANEKLEEEPRTTIRVIPPTISKTVLTKRADFYERILGDTLTFWMFAEELAQVTDAGKAGYSNLRTIMRTAYDLGSLFGIDYASDNSYSAIVDINICSMFCATPAALDEYYDRKAIEGGNITRCIVCPLDDDIESDNEIFLPYTVPQLSTIKETLNLMMQDTYTPEGQLQPTKELDMSWLDNDCRRFIKRKAREYSLSGSEAIKVFRKRASVSAFRVTTLCYYLYLLEAGGSSGSSGSNGTNLKPSETGACTEHGRSEGLKPSDTKIRNLCKKIYNFLSEYILQGLLNRWGEKFNELNAKRAGESSTQKPKLYDLCTETFTRDQLKLLIKQQDLTTPARTFISLWKKLKLIVEIDKNTFKKV